MISIYEPSEQVAPAQASLEEVGVGEVDRMKRPDVHKHARTIPRATSEVLLDPFRAGEIMENDGKRMKTLQIWTRSGGRDTHVEARAAEEVLVDKGILPRGPGHP